MGLVVSQYLIGWKCNLYEIILKFVVPLVNWQYEQQQTVFHGA
uniref:Uncharacterized protein n=1 Tax=Arundo donax TaxID=35708 RepID=A0A0A9AKB3_ARUDO